MHVLAGDLHDKHSQHLPWLNGDGTTNLRNKAHGQAKKCFGEADAQQSLLTTFTDAQRCSPVRDTH